MSHLNFLRGAVENHSAFAKPTDESDTFGSMVAQQHRLLPTADKKLFFMGRVQSAYIEALAYQPHSTGAANYEHWSEPTYTSL